MDEYNMGMRQGNVESSGNGGFSFFNRVARESWEILKVFIVSLAIVLPIRYFVAQPFIVRGASMEPNFEDQEYLVIDELSYYLREPQRGEVVVFRYPKDPRQFFIKRIMGLPGEKVVIKSGRITIYNSQHPQGVLIEEPYLSPPNHPTYPDMEHTIPAGQFFVLGDNRDFSSDSRIWGFLSRNLVVGRALFRAWPLARVGLVSEVLFPM